MDTREKLMRNEILYLADNLRVVSHELIVLQDFIKKEFGARYIKFCESRQDEDEMGQRHNFSNGSLPSCLPVPRPQPPLSFENSSSNASRFWRRRNLSSRPRSFTDESEDGLRRIRIENASTTTPFQETHNTDSQDAEGSSDASSAPIFQAWKTEQNQDQSEDPEDNFELYIPGSDDDGDEDDESDIANKSKKMRGEPKYAKDMPVPRPVNLLRFVKSTRTTKTGGDKDMVALDGFLYHINNFNEKTSYYLCTVRKSGCKARLIVKKNLGTFQQKGEHTHGPNPDKIRAQEVIAAGKQLAVANPELPMQQVMSHIESLIEEPTEALGLGTPMEVQRKIRRARQKAREISSNHMVTIAPTSIAVSQNLDSGGSNMILETPNQNVHQFIHPSYNLQSL